MEAHYTCGSDAEVTHLAHKGTGRGGYTFCGTVIGDSWAITPGITHSGVCATCSRCRRISELQPPRF